MVFFLAFLPVRVIHAATIGTDSMTVPLFVLVLFLLNRFLSEETPNVRGAVLLSLGLAVAVWTKYGFMAFIPAVFLILLSVWAEHRWKVQRFVAICALTASASFRPRSCTVSGRAAASMAITPKSTGSRKAKHLK